MLMTGTAPSGDRFRMGSMAAEQVDETGPTTATTLGSAAKAFALRAHFAGLGNGEEALASSHTWTPTVSLPARHPRWARTIFTACAFWMPWSLCGPCSGPLLTITTSGRPFPP